MKPLLSVLLAIAPFGAGLIRAMSARDFRLLWMACAAFVGAVLVRLIAKRRRRGPLGTLLVATVFAAATGYLLGATAAAGIWPMAFVLGLCLAASHALATGSPTDATNPRESV
jgi:hypothetical protein